MVYFIRGRLTRLIKIGYTENFKSLSYRLSALRSASPDDLELICLLPFGTLADEANLHTIFAHNLEKHEWFREAADLINFCYTRKHTRASIDYFTKDRLLGANLAELELPNKGELPFYGYRVGEFSNKQIAERIISRCQARPRRRLKDY